MERRKSDGAPARHQSSRSVESSTTTRSRVQDANHVPLAIANFSAYTYLKKFLQDLQEEKLPTDMKGSNLPGWQTSIIGLISGAVGPFTNAPIDTIKTRLQRTPGEEGQTAMGRIAAVSRDMFKAEGTRAFYKGITPRVMRVAPGQAVTLYVTIF